MRIPQIEGEAPSFAICASASQLSGSSRSRVVVRGFLTMRAT
jgi:hypothetical protein